MKIQEDATLCIEPFVGNGDMLKFINEFPNKTVEYYDIDPKIPGTIKRDTIRDPPEYKNKFVLTNPPYLARNKSSDKYLYDLYKCNDLYKCFLITLINDKCKGGIIIIPLNFLSSIRKADADLRRRFLEVYDIQHVNIFEESVFDDTSYAVCAIMFTSDKSDDSAFVSTVYPSRKKITLYLNKDNNYTIGGELYALSGSSFKVSRATAKTDINTISNILLKCIDDNKDRLLGVSMVSDDVAESYIDTTPKLSSRSYATVVIEPAITLDKQKKLVNKFNDFINHKRYQYNSLFLPQYRNSNTVARKRISFSLSFSILSYLLETL